MRRRDVGGARRGDVMGNFASAVGYEVKKHASTLEGVDEVPPSAQRERVR